MDLGTQLAQEDIARMPGDVTPQEWYYTLVGQGLIARKKHYRAYTEALDEWKFSWGPDLDTIESLKERFPEELDAVVRDAQFTLDEAQDDAVQQIYDGLHRLAEEHKLNLKETDIEDEADRLSEELY